MSTQPSIDKEAVEPKSTTGDHKDTPAKIDKIADVSTVIQHVTDALNGFDAKDLWAWRRKIKEGEWAWMYMPPYDGKPLYEIESADGKRSVVEVDSVTRGPEDNTKGKNMELLGKVVKWIPRDRDKDEMLKLVRGLETFAIQLSCFEK